MSLGENIKRKREQLKLSQEVVAERLGDHSSGRLLSGVCHGVLSLQPY